MKTLIIFSLALLFGVPVIAADDPAKDDLTLAQGKWIRIFEVGDLQRRQIKDIQGNKETVTVYQGEEIISQWTVEFEITQTEKVRIFTFRHGVVTRGENKGEEFEGPFSYLFQIRDDKWLQVDGIMNGDTGTPNIQIYERVKE